MATETRPAARDRTKVFRTSALIAAALALVLVLYLLGRASPHGGKAGGLFGPIFAFFANQPFILIFLLVAAGYAGGRLTFRGFNLGATAATLLLGLGISLWASLRGVTFSVHDFASSLFFNLFMFAMGMKVGPQFLAGLRRGARSFIVLGLLVPLVSVGLAFVLRSVMHLPPGLAPGILAGANTATPGIGAAKGVYLAEGAAPATIANLSTAFAFGYCASLVLFVLMMKAMPRWFGSDPKKEALVLQREIEAGSKHPLPGTAESLEPVHVEVRVFRVEEPAFAGKTVEDLERALPHVAVEQLQHQGMPVERAQTQRIAIGDFLALSGPLPTLVKAGPLLGPEAPESSMRAIGMETVEVVAQSKRAVGRYVDELLSTVGRGFTLNALFRGGEEIPHGPATRVMRGDVFRVTGSQLRVKELEQTIGGRVVHASATTDVVTLALGLAVGAFLGAIPIPIPGLTLSLGSAVGLLLAGILLSILRTRNPKLGGPFPEPARQLLEDLGLNVFIAITSLNAGAGVIQAVRAGAVLPMAIGTVTIGLVPPLVGWIVGQYRQHMNAGLLTGAITGARCSSPGLRAAQEITESAVPALSYPVTFAISNVVITLFCYVLATLD
jgi:putative transport protein